MEKYIYFKFIIYNVIFIIFIIKQQTRDSDRLGPVKTELSRPDYIWQNTDSENPDCDRFRPDLSKMSSLKKEGDEVSKLHKRLRETKQHAWRRCKHEYIHSLLESHRVNRKTASVPDIREIVLVEGDEKN